MGQFIWEEHVLGEALRSRGCSIPLAQEDLASNCWDWRGGPDFSRQVSVGLPPLGWQWGLSTNRAYPIGRPSNPARFQHPWWRAPRSNFPYFQHSGRPWASLGDVYCLASGKTVETPSPLSGNILEDHPRAPLYGLSSGCCSTSGSQKGYSPLLSKPTQGPQLSVQELTPQMATTATTGVDTWDISQPLT